MTFPAAVAEEFATSPLIELYTLDTTPIALLYDPDSPPVVLDFTPMTDPDQGGSFEVTWGTTQYSVIPVTADGFTRTSNAQVPRPTISVANAHQVLAGMLFQFGDLLGAKLTRTVILQEWTQTGSNPDGTAYLKQDVYRVVQKEAQTPEWITFRLAAALDVNRWKIPKRLMLRDTCQHRYRVWDPTAGGGGGAFDYNRTTCPYTGVASYDFYNDVTLDLADVCRKDLAACKLRFPNDPAPITAFPGLGTPR